MRTRLIHLKNMSGIKSGNEFCFEALVWSWNEHNKVGLFIRTFHFKNIEFIKNYKHWIKKNRHSFPECHKNIISIQYAHYCTTCSGPHSKKNSESFFAEHEYQSASAGTSRRFGDVGRGRRFRSNWGRTVNRSGRCNVTDGARRGAGGTAVGNRRPPVLRGVVTRGRRSIEAASPQFRAEMLNMWKVRELVDKAWVPERRWSCLY